MIAIDLSKQQGLDADPRAIQQVNFTSNLDDKGQRCSSLLKKRNKLFLNFHKEPKKFYEYKVQFIFYQYKMTQYNSLNVKLSNSQLNKLKSAIKNETEVVLRLSSNIIGDNETNFPHKLLLTDRQVSSLRKSFANNSSGDIKLSKSQLSKMIQSGGFLSRLLGPLLKTGLQLIKNVIKPS